MFILLATLTAAHAIETTDAVKANLVSNVIFIHWDADHPTITLVSGFDAETRVWNRIHVLDDGDGIKEGVEWRFNVPAGLAADFDEIVLFPSIYRAVTLTLFENARVAVSIKPTEFNMSESGYYPNTVGRGDSHYFSYTNIAKCEGTACNNPNLTQLPRLAP